MRLLGTYLYTKVFTTKIFYLLILLERECHEDKIEGLNLVLTWDGGRGFTPCTVTPEAIYKPLSKYQSTLHNDSFVIMLTVIIQEYYAINSQAFLQSGLSAGIFDLTCPKPLSLPL